VVNTPFFLVKDGNWTYLHGGGNWYRASSVKGKWMPIGAPSRGVAHLFEQATVVAAPSETPVAGESVVPDILVRTAPAELIATDGAPQYGSVEGTQLLYMTNTESDVVLDISTQTYYVLLAGRWYTSKSLEKGPWTFMGNDELPADFARIPPKSDMGNLLTSVAGTQEAKEAVLESHIPQTAAVDRATATLTVTYDGEPKFSPIEGTSMSYAVNTDKSVLKIGARYYCCDEAIWFVGISPKGPWEVCTEVPQEVQSIPPQCPVYNVKYVYVYDVTPQVVYCGYTPGYVHSYVYHGCVVYGTGWYYRPWYGRYYYPRPVTWGFAVHYNPWTGWGFSFGMTNGWLHIGFGYWRPPYYGWWGPAGYRHRHYYRYHTPWRPRPPRPEHYANNVYRKRPTGVVSTMDRKRPARPATLPAETRPSVANNIYAGPDGAIHRRTKDGWDQRRDGQWQSMDYDAIRDKL